MDGLFSAAAFRDFGPSFLATDAVPPALTRLNGSRPSALRRQLQVLCPRKPGVYGMLDDFGELLYVGKAKQLRVRLLSYFRPQSRWAKPGRLLRQVREIVWEICPDEFAALLREQELIRRWRPRYNVQGQPLRRRLAFVCLGRAPAPYLFLARHAPADVVAVVGPVPWTERSVRVVQLLNDYYLLRDCPQPQEIFFPDQPGLFGLQRPPGCLRAELGNCLAPCTGTCPRATYAAQVRAACDFLTGRSRQPLDMAHLRMQQAAAAGHFELAAVWRDRRADFAWLADHLRRVREAQETMSFVYPLAGSTGAVTWYFVHGARVLASLPAPSDVATAQRAVAALDAVFGQLRSPQLLTHYEHHDGRLVVLQWFQRHPAERAKTLTVSQARRLAARFVPGTSVAPKAAAVRLRSKRTAS
ncbi:MAG: GIY-YIG nuclease family protein [Gemmataceae bacterium]|nr:GIY-YIG nuclease family protein [Gemmataceae bacterium]